MWILLCFAVGGLLLPYSFIYEDSCGVEMVRAVYFHLENDVIAFQELPGRYRILFISQISNLAGY